MKKTNKQTNKHTKTKTKNKKQKQKQKNKHKKQKKNLELGLDMIFKQFQLKIYFCSLCRDMFFFFFFFFQKKVIFAIFAKINILSAIWYQKRILRPISDPKKCILLHTSQL